jgi:hypothetical protein
MPGFWKLLKAYVCPSKDKAWIIWMILVRCFQDKLLLPAKIIVIAWYILVWLKYVKIIEAQELRINI